MAEGNSFYLKVGDTWPAIEARLEEWDNGTGAYVPVDLTDADVLFRCSIVGAGNPMLEAPATVKYPADQADVAKRGIVYYLWALDGSDTGEAGTHQVEWQVTFANGRIATFPRGGTPNFNELIIEQVVT